MVQNFSFALDEGLLHFCFSVGCLRLPFEYKKNVDSKHGVVISETDTALANNAQTLFNTCAACHGNNAEGNRGFNAPALVNQDAWYLEKQLQNFKIGFRGADERDSLGLRMATIARSLYDSLSIASLVDYIKSLQPTGTGGTVIGNVRAGMSHYNMICGACHGPGAEGNKELGSPKLIGIDDWYLERQLIHFKNGIRGSHPEDKSGAQMKQMASTLKDEQAIKDVVAYIQSFQQKNL